jgi:hypothetical protein
MVQILSQPPGFLRLRRESTSLMRA